MSIPNNNHFRTRWAMEEYVQGCENLIFRHSNEKIDILKVFFAEIYGKKDYRKDGVVFRATIPKGRREDFPLFQKFFTTDAFPIFDNQYEQGWSVIENDAKKVLIKKINKYKEIEHLLFKRNSLYEGLNQIKQLIAEEKEIVGRWGRLEVIRSWAHDIFIKDFIDRYSKKYKKRKKDRKNKINPGLNDNEGNEISEKYWLQTFLELCNKKDFIDNCGSFNSSVDRNDYSWSSSLFVSDFPVYYPVHLRRKSWYVLPLYRNLNLLIFKRDNLNRQYKIIRDVASNKLENLEASVYLNSLHFYLDEYGAMFMGCYEFRT